MQKFKWIAVALACAVTMVPACGDDSDDDSNAGAGGTTGGSGGTTGGTSAGSGGTSGGSGNAGSGGSGGMQADSGMPDGSDPEDDGGVEPDAGDDAWDGCPSANDFVGPSSGATTLRVAQDAVYCTLWNESWSFEQARDSKLQVRFAPGDYPLGTSAGVAVRLPTCLRVATGAAPTITMTAPLMYMQDSFGATETHRYSWNAPLSGGPFETLQMGFDIETAPGGTPLLVLDGAENDLDGNAWHRLLICTDSECAIPFVLDSCTYPSARLHTHAVTLAGGEVSFSLRIGDSFASTEPGAFTGASGVWQGESFEQDDFFKLLYVPAHHHFERSFIVLFEEPIAGACGLRVSNLDPFDTSVGNAATVDCALQDIATVSISAHDYTVEP